MVPPTSAVNPPPPAPSTGRIFKGLTVFVHPSMPDAIAIVLANGGHTTPSPYDQRTTHLVLTVSSSFPPNLVVKGAYAEHDHATYLGDKHLMAEVSTLINQFAAVREGGGAGSKWPRKYAMKTALRPEWIHACVDAGRVLGRMCGFGGWMIELSFDGSGVDILLAGEERLSHVRERPASVPPLNANVARDTRHVSKLQRMMSQDCQVNGSSIIPERLDGTGSTDLESRYFPKLSSSGLAAGASLARQTPEASWAPRSQASNSYEYTPLKDTSFGPSSSRGGCRTPSIPVNGALPPMLPAFS
ncbi:hypothetical protein IAT38_006182 [Cryptococcus sp. DSM 104549]